jgi:hypothetical protein
MNKITRILETTFSTIGRAGLAFLILLISFSSSYAQIGCVMVCNDVITVEVPAGGSVEFLPTDMLEGNVNQQCPNGVFQAQVQLNNVFLPASGNFVFDSTHIGQTYIGQIRDEVSGNACWGEVQVTGSSPNISGTVSLFEPDGAMKVSPNPSNHSIILKVASQESTFKVRVLDMQGCLVLQQTIQNEGKLDVSGLPNGLYSLWAITASGKMFRSKFEKQG